MAVKQKTGGMVYRQPYVIGKHRYRVRERHVRDHLAPLLRRGAVGAAKLDLALRGVALNPDHVGNRPEPGIVLPRYSYEDLHDLVRDPLVFGPDIDAKGTLSLKRKWVREQLERLERLKLLERRSRPGRPQIVMLRDDGSGDPFDDPDGKGDNSYVTVHGALFASQEVRGWRAPELAFYLAAMTAERYETQRQRTEGLPASEEPPVGGGTWFRQLSWFSGKAYARPNTHVLFPFSEATLERGLTSLRQAGLVEVRSSALDPYKKTRFRWVRNVYTNRFITLEKTLPTMTDREMVEAIAAVEKGAQEVVGAF